jgi:hypothetical protein
MTINRVLATKKVLYMLALDMKDVFGAVSHDQLRKNLKKFNFCQSRGKSLWTVMKVQQSR